MKYGEAGLFETGLKKSDRPPLHWSWNDSQTKQNESFKEYVSSHSIKSIMGKGCSCGVSGDLYALYKKYYELQKESFFSFGNTVDDRLWNFHYKKPTMTHVVAVLTELHNLIRTGDIKAESITPYMYFSSNAGFCTLRIYDNKKRVPLIDIVYDYKKKKTSTIYFPLMKWDKDVNEFEPIVMAGEE